MVPAVESMDVFPDFDRERRQIVDSKLLTIRCEDFDLASEPHLILTCSCEVRQQERRVHRDNDAGREICQQPVQLTLASLASPRVLNAAR